MKYVALLRGVNVGGHRRVPRTDFQKILENLGFRDIIIYINSGNAVFTSATVPDTKQVQSALEDFFGFDIPTLILSDNQIKTIADAIPNDWINDTLSSYKSGQKSDVIYLFDDINHPDILDKIGHNPETETMYYIDGAIITTISRANQAKGSLQKIIGTKLYTKMTIRNINTARKLAELVG